MTPKLSVVIPTYNRREMVQEAIDSVLAQTYTDYEIIVVDDGSTDGTGEALQACYGDRIRYVRQENQGESVARNRGIEMARGEYIALLDSDDLWLPEKLAKQVPVLDTNPRVGMAFSQAWVIDANGNRLDLPPVGHALQPLDLTLERLCVENTVPAGGSTLLAWRHVLDNVGGFDPNIRFGEDWDLWLRLRIQWDIVCIDEPLACVRRHVNTQCHLPRSEHVERALNDHLALLTRAFADWPGSPEKLPVMRDRSLARQYARAAFASYAWNRWNQGCHYLARATTLDPATWRDAKRLKWMLQNYGVAIGEVEGTFRVERMRKYLNGTFSHWPEDLNLPSRTYQQVLARLCAEASYRSYLSGNRRATRHFAWHAFRADYSLLRDRGMVRRFLTSVV